MSKREFIVILLAAIVLAVALPFVAAQFKPGEAGPEPLPGVPFSTTAERLSPNKAGEVQPASLTFTGQLDLLHVPSAAVVIVELHSRASRIEGWWRSGRIQLDEAGRFTFSAVPGTELKIVASYEQFIGAEIQFTVTKRSPSDLGVLRMQPRCATQLRFVDKTHAPRRRLVRLLRVNALPDFYLVRNARSTGIWGVSADMEFEVQFPEDNMLLPYGFYVAQMASVPWYLDENSPKPPNSAAVLLPFEVHSPKARIDFEVPSLPGQCELKCIVTNMSGEPLRTTKIQLIHEGPGPFREYVKSESTDENGEFYVASLPPGVYCVCAGNWTRRFVVTAADSGLRTIRLDKPPTSLGIRVMRKGEPTAGVSIRAEMFDNRSAEAITDAQGMAMLVNLEFPCTIRPRLAEQFSAWAPFDRVVDRPPTQNEVVIIDLEPPNSVVVTGELKFNGKVFATSSSLLLVGADVPIKSIRASVSVDEDGRFLCRGLPRGRYLASIEAHNHEEIGNRKNLGPQLEVWDLLDPNQTTFVFNRDISTRSFRAELVLEDIRKSLATRLASERLDVRFFLTDLRQMGNLYHGHYAMSEKGVLEFWNLPFGEYELQTGLSALDDNPSVPLRARFTVDQKTGDTITIALSTYKPQLETLPTGFSLELSARGDATPSCGTSGWLEVADSTGKRVFSGYESVPLIRRFDQLVAGTYRCKFVMEPGVQWSATVTLIEGESKSLSAELDWPFANVVIHVRNAVNAGLLYGAFAECPHWIAEFQPRQEPCAPALLEGNAVLYVRAMQLGRCFEIVLPDGTRKSFEMPKSLTKGQDAEFVLTLSK